MAESQSHGFEFEKWIIENKLTEVFNTFKSEVKYTNEWDIPPCSIKSFKFKNKNPTIEFGSIQRIFENQTSYLLVLVGYKQLTPNIKSVIFSDVVFIQKNEMKLLKGNLNLEIINELCEKIKSYKQGEHNEARKWAAEEKLKNNNQTQYDIRFKIDSKAQRRIQCALKLEDLYKSLGKEIIIENKLNIPNIISESRKRNI